MRFRSRLLLHVLVLAGFPEVAGAEEGHVTFQAPGQYAHRAQLLSQVPLYAPIDGVPTSLDQEVFGYHWFRVTPTLNWSERLVITGQIDLLRGTIWGDTAEDVGGDTGGRDDYDGYKSVDPRWLFAELRAPGGTFFARAGQMGSHWGLGLLANDGAHETFFGDPIYGDIVERVLFQTGPIPIVPLEGGLVLAAGGDFVFDDGIADVEDGDRAVQGVFAAVLVREDSQFGTYAVYRSQTNDLDDELQIAAFDLFGKIEGPLPGGGTSDKVTLGFEGVVVTGESSFLRTVDRDVQNVLQGGALAEVGATTRWLDLAFEMGWASGDGNTLDDTVTRFTFDPDHNVGLVLFDEVIAWQTARAAALAQSPDVAGRPARGIGLLPSRGGVSGAMYLYPTLRVKPLPRLDVRFGAVVAQATSDVVDPFQQKVSGAARNYRGGSSESRDLGLELDAGVRWQLPLRYVNLDLGVEGGVLLPGHAFDDENGEGMDPIAAGRLRAGLSW